MDSIEIMREALERIIARLLDEDQVETCDCAQCECVRIARAALRAKGENDGPT